MENNKQKSIDNQKKTISRLQDIINLQKFDITNYRKEIKFLRDKLVRRNGVIDRAREELYRIKRDGDIRRINLVIRILKEIDDEKN